MPEIANLVVRYSSDTKSAEAGADRVNSSIGKVTKAGAALAIAGGALLGGFFAKSIGAAANFEQGMDGVAASLGGVGVAGGITADQFTRLQEEALRIGQTTSVGATDAARAMDLLAKSGIDVESIYSGVAQGVVDVSTATGESLEQSAASFGSFTNMFQGTGISAEQMSDTIVNAMNASQMTLSEFQTGIARLAPVISATGMSFQDSSAALAYFNSIGFSSAEVGTSLTAAFNNLVAPTTEQATAMEQLGIHAFDAQGAFVGFPDILDQVKEATEGMTDAQRAETIATLFGQDARDLMTEATKKGGDPLRDYTKLMNKSGTAATAAATRMDNLKGDVENLKGAFETLSIKVGNAMLPALRGLTQGLTDVVVGATKLGEGFFKTVGNAEEFSKWVQQFPGWAQPALKALGGMYQAGGDLVDAFQEFKRGDFAGGFRELREAASTAWSAISDLASTTLDWVLDTGIPTVVGWVVDNAGDVWNGIKSLAGWAWDGLADVGSWSLNVGLPNVVGAITGIAGRLGDWLRSYIYGGGAVGDGTGGPEPGPGGGVMVDIAQITLNVLDATANIQAAQLQGWIQERIDEIGTVKAEVKEWQIIIEGDPDVQGQPEQRSKSKLERLIGLADYVFPIAPWVIEVARDPDIVGDPIKRANDTLQDMVRAAKIAVNNVDWILGLVVPEINLPSAASVVAAVKSELPSISVSGVKWALGLSLPDINLPSGSAIKAAIRVAGEAAGIPGWILDRVVGDASPTPAMEWGAPFGSPPPNVSALNRGEEGTRVGGELVTQLPNVGSGSTAALNQAKAAAQQVAAAMAQLTASVRTGVQQAIAALNPLGAAFTQTTTRVNATVTQMRAQVTANVTAMVAQTRAQFTAMQAATSAIVTAMTAQIRAQFTSLQASTTASANAMRSSVQSAMQGMAAAGQSAMSQFSSAVRSGFSQAVAAAQSGVAGIRGAVNSIGSLYGQGFSIGSSFGQGVAAGLYSMLGAVQAAAAAIVAAAAQAAAAAGRISSPSKLMRDEIGVPLAQGVIVGLDSQRSNVASAFASMIPVDANLGRGYRGAGAGAYAARGGAGGPMVQHVTIVTLEPGKWQEYLKKADNGDRAYQQQQPRSRDRQLGSSR